MVLGLLVLVGCQLVGEFAARAFGLPIPGPVLGMALLFVALTVRGRRRAGSRASRRQAGGLASPAGAAAGSPSATASPQAPATAVASREPSSVERAADGLIEHLQLLFIPAGAGVVLYLSDLAHAGLPVAGGLAVGWLATLGATAVVALVLLRWQERRSGPPGTGPGSGPGEPLAIDPGNAA